MPTEVYSDTRTNRHFSSIQILRALAACMVVVYHSTQAWSLVFGNHLGAIWEAGAAGVDIFFVVSGFVMALSCLGRRDLSASTFLKGRAIRIVPLYWMATAGVVLKMALTHSEVTIPYLATSLLFVPFRTSPGFVHTLVTVGWTLCFETFFYVLIAIALYFQINVILFVAMAIIFLSLGGPLIPVGWTAPVFWANPILIEFLTGLLLGGAYLKGFRLNPYASALLGMIGIAAILKFTPGVLAVSRPIEWGIPALLIVLSAVMLEGSTSRLAPTWILKIGTASYALYLTPFHPIVIVAMSRMVHSESATAALSLAASVAVALLVHRHIEIPAACFLKSWTLASLCSSQRQPMRNSLMSRLYMLLPGAPLL